jgi:glucose/arabinose dehydrogenase
MKRIRFFWGVLNLALLMMALLVGEAGDRMFVPPPVLAQVENSTPGAQVLITRNTNLRAGPGTGQPILTVARPGQRYVITGQNEDASWWRIDYEGQEAWIYAPLVTLVDEADRITAAPVLLPTPTPDAASAGAVPSPLPASEEGGIAAATIVRAINVRSGPGTGFRILATAQPGERYSITGQNSAGNWWRIDYQGQEGWLFASLVQASNSATVPVVETPVLAAAPTSSSASAPVAASAPSPATRFDPQQVQFRLEPVFGGLEQPTYLTHAGDGSGRLFVVERPGRVRVYPGPQTEGQIFLDITDQVGTSGGEQGMFSIAFPPTFRTTGYFFVNYTNNDGDTIIARYRVGDDANRADRDSGSVVLFQQQPARNHNGGMLLFGPDGRLWVGLGDGGGANDTFQNGQNPGTLLGAMLRLDVTSDPSVPYRIPADNPWVNRLWQGQEVRDEIWAIGLRNPWRYSFDRRTGDLWIADVGQSQSEEINFLSAQQVRQGGFNFGWPIMEGPYCLGAPDCAKAGLVLPIAEYGHAGNGCSITGGYVYRGQAFPQLDGVYFFADFCSGNVWAYWRPAGGAAQTALILPKAAAISSFGEDEAGELYVADFGGVVHRLVAEEGVGARTD